MAAINPSALALSDSDRQTLDTWLAEFDRSWHDGALAERVQALSDLPAALHFPALVEMVKLDLARQWQQGRRVTLESYLEGHARLGTPYTVPADLIQAEYEARQRLGETPDLAEFSRRFPGRIDELKRLLSVARETTSLTPEQLRQATPSPVETRPGGPGQPAPTVGTLPEQFGRYRIIRKLGQGGMGTVYLAHDAQFDRPVALKVPHFTPDDGPEVIERFYREARAAAVLHHANFCPVYDVGEIGGIPYLTMAYLEGRSLAEVLRDGPLLVDKAVRLTRTLAAALEETHRRDVIHRDLKPSNVLLTTNGEPVILDFGLARRTGRGDVRLTQTGALLGTPAYMAPEQVSSKDEPAPACDIYSLGALLYELLTGRPPFVGTLEVVIPQVLLDRPAPPSSLRPEIGPRLDAVCLKALEKKAEERHASMAAFAAALDSCLGQPPVSNEPTVPIPHANVPPVRRSRRRLWLTAAAAAAVLVGAVFLFIKLYTGTVQVEVDVAGAVILIDGERPPEGADRKIRLPVGEHVVVVKYDGIAMATQTFDVNLWRHKVVMISIAEQVARERAKDSGIEAMKMFSNVAGGFFDTFGKMATEQGLKAPKVGEEIFKDLGIKPE